MINQFIKAYCSMYGASKKEALAAYKKANEEYRKMIIEAFKTEAKKSFYFD